MEENTSAENLIEVEARQYDEEDVGEKDTFVSEYCDNLF